MNTNNSQIEQSIFLLSEIRSRINTKILINMASSVKIMQDIESDESKSQEYERLMSENEDLFNQLDSVKEKIKALESL